MRQALPLFVIALAGVSRASTIIVPPGGSIQAAIDTAIAGDTIVITSTATPYVENVTWSGKALTIQGSNPAAPPTVKPLARTAPVFMCTGLASTSVLRDVIVFSDGTSGANFDSGLVLDDADVQLFDVRVSGFRESRGLGGGGARVFASTPVFTDCRFDGNASTTKGGGIWTAASLVTVRDTVFEANSASEGGGIALVQRMFDDVEDEELIADGCTFDGNSASTTSMSGGGGAVRAAGWYFLSWNQAFAVRTTFTECVFDSNTAVASGGALALTYATTTIDDCTFNANSVERNRGGALYASGRPIAIRDCVLTGNHSATSYTCPTTNRGVGGAIAILATEADDGVAGFGPIEISGCTISGNEAFFGGGICFGKLGGENSGLRWSQIDVFENVIDDNVARVLGGGLLRLTHVSDPESTARHTIRDNVVSHNWAMPLLPYGIEGRSFGGGGMALYGQKVELVVEHNDIGFNTSTGLGGGILTEDSNAQIRFNEIHDNAVSSAADEDDFESICALCPGEAYSCDEEAVWADLPRALAARGGGIATTGSAGELIVGNRIVGNGATGSLLGAGGGVDMRVQPTETITLQANLISQNHASHEGGGVGSEYWPRLWLEEPVIPDALVDVLNNTLIDNSTDGDGGGIHIAAQTQLGRLSNNILMCNTAQGDGGGIGGTPGSTITPSRYAYNNLYQNDANGPGDQWGAPFNPLTQGTFSNTGFDPKFVGYTACGQPAGDPCDFRLGNTSLCRHRADPRPDDNNCDGTRGDQGLFGGPALCEESPCEIPWVLGLQPATQAGCQITYTWTTPVSASCQLGYRIGTGAYTWLSPTVGTSHSATFTYTHEAHYNVKIVSTATSDGLVREKQTNFAYPCYSGGG